MSNGMIDDVLSPVQTAPQPPAQVRATLDDLSGARPGVETQFAFGETAGDTIKALPPAKIEVGVTLDPATIHQEAGPEPSEAGEEFVEASAEQLAAATGAEAGEESAFSDLTAEGFGPRIMPAADAPLREAGTVIEAGQQEFLPILASLVPTLVSSVGPAVAKAISAKLQPRTRTAIRAIAKRTPAPRTPIGAAVAKTIGSGGLTGVLPIIAKLFEAAETGTEAAGAGAVDEAVVAEAAAVIETVIGIDQRQRITNTTGIPWRRYCALRIQFPSGATYRGTGFFIGPRAVATAGHCVYMRNQGGWARKIEVIPGSNGAARPFGSAWATEFRSTGGWVNSGLPEADYACMFLPRGSFSGMNLGSFGAAAFDSSVLLAQPAVLAGYPGDKPFAELWGMAQVIKAVSAKTLVYDIDTYGGQSGAPLYIKRNGVRYVVGIHNYGAATGNSATRVTEPVYRLLAAWAKM